MRRVRDDDGAVMVVVALVMITLLSIGAIVIDVGRLYQERRVLQSGADAGALAVAQDCASAGGCGSYLTTAGAYANANADDSTSNVDEVCGTGAGLPACSDPPTAPANVDYAEVRTSTRTKSGSNQLPFYFAPLMGFTGKTVTASAVAAWGGADTIPGGLPLTIPLCVYDLINNLSFDPPTLEAPPADSTTTVIDLHNTIGAWGQCHIQNPGLDTSGNFGWLATDPGSCSATAIVDLVFAGKPGNSIPNDCKSILTSGSLVGQTVALPIFSSVTGKGSGAEFTIAGFAAFHITGYKFPGIVQPAGPDPCTGNGDSSECIVGYFTNAPITGGTPGGPNLGVIVVGMIG